MHITIRACGVFYDVIHVYVHLESHTGTNQSKLTLSDLLALTLNNMIVIVVAKETPHLRNYMPHMEFYLCQFIFTNLGVYPVYWAFIGANTIVIMIATWSWSSLANVWFRLGSRLFVKHRSSIRYAYDSTAMIQLRIESMHDWANCWPSLCVATGIQWNGCKLPLIGVLAYRNCLGALHLCSQNKYLDAYPGVGTCLRH